MNCYNQCTIYKTPRPLTEHDNKLCQSVYGFVYCDILYVILNEIMQNDNKPPQPALPYRKPGPEEL